jgi:hypothetical protein
MRGRRILNFVTKGVWMLFGAVISVLVRNVREDYNESASIGMAVSNLTTHKKPVRRKGKKDIGERLRSRRGRRGRGERREEREACAGRQLKFCRIFFDSLRYITALALQLLQ